MISSFFLSRGEYSSLHWHSNRTFFFTIPLYSVFLLLILFFCNQCHASLSLSGKLNINDATKGELLLLPEINQVMAKAISDHREMAGNFKDIQSLFAVNGLSEKTLLGILPYLRLTGESTLSIVNDESKIATPISPPHSPEILLLKNKQYLDVLLQAIEKANKEIFISMFLFKTYPYKSSATNRLMDALIKAVDRGVDVIVILEEGKDKNNSVTKVNKNTAKRLKKGGVSVIFDDPQRTTHTKVVVVDKRDVFLGSHNLTSSALKYNNELSIHIKSDKLAEKVLTYIRDLI